jgi:hypothetical protein
VKNIIPNIDTDRNWLTVNLPELAEYPEQYDLNHSIIFIHNNIQPNAYQWLRKYHDLILVCGLKTTMQNVKFFGTPIYLPLSVDVKKVSKYKTALKTKEMAFAGRINKLNNRVPKACDILTGVSQPLLLRRMSYYKKIYAVGRTAIQPKILGCEIGIYDERFPDSSIWKIIDNKDVIPILQNEINKIDKGA